MTLSMILLAAVMFGAAIYFAVTAGGESYRWVVACLYVVSGSSVAYGFVRRVRTSR